MNKIFNIATTIVIAFSIGCCLLMYQYPRKQMDLKCLSENHNNEGKFLDSEERQSTYYFRVIIYRWWTKIWEQSEGEVWNGGPQNIMPIIFYENNLSTVQFRSDDGVLEGYLDGKSKKFALREKGITVRGDCLNNTELPF